jgi:hypothetical protein
MRSGSDASYLVARVTSICRREATSKQLGRRKIEDHFFPRSKSHDDPFFLDTYDRREKGRDRLRSGAEVTTSIELAREFGPFIRERADGRGPKQPKSASLQVYGPLSSLEPTQSLLEISRFYDGSLFL